jgi:DNA-binding transcriptional MerR regulator
MDDCVTGPEAAQRSGCTYRQVTYWVRSGFITPSGTPRRGNSLAFTARDIAVLIALRRASEAGVAFNAVGPLLAQQHIDNNAAYLVISGRENLRAACLHDDSALAELLSDDVGPHVVTRLELPQPSTTEARRTA